LYRNVKFSRLSIFSWGKSIYFFEEAGMESREPELTFLPIFLIKKASPSWQIALYWLLQMIPLIDLVDWPHSNPY
jgi:hypothetical protein